MSLFTPGMGCGPAETRVGIDGVLARIRADAPAGPRGAAKAGAAERRNAQGAARRAARSPHSRSARKAPSRAEEEPRAAVMRSFYTCKTAPLPDLTEGTGWRLVGPLRQS